MVVDDERKHVLKKYASTTGSKKIVESDHNPLMCELKFKWIKKAKPIRKEIFNLRDPEGLINFQSLTSNCPELVMLSKKSQHFQTDVTQWLMKLNNIMHLSFKKIRISNGSKPVSPEIANLFRIQEFQKKQLSKIPSNDVMAIASLKSKIVKIDHEIALRCADENSDKIMKHTKEISNGDGDVARLNMWKLKKKLFPKHSEVPTAKKNSTGELVTDPQSLKEIYVETYKKRLSHRNMRPGLEFLEFIKKLLFQLRYYLSKKNPSKPWTKDQLMTVLKSLKTGKSADALGFSNELFKPNIIGNDFLDSLVVIVNRAKSETEIPKPFRLTAITSIYKQKGDKSDLTSDRGIFNVTKFRSLTDKLIYNDIYEKMDKNMTSSNCGGRRNRSIRDNLCVLYAIINDALGFLKVDIDVQFFLP